GRCSLHCSSVPPLLRMGRSVRGIVLLISGISARNAGTRRLLAACRRAHLDCHRSIIDRLVRHRSDASTRTRKSLAHFANRCRVYASLLAS
ncbi:hypothetical protein PENTCL1PPCAC_5466, partial [Pristionchus entomophagus]